MSWLRCDVLGGYKQGWKLTEEHRVVLVNWEDVRALCAWLSEKTGIEWCLPSSREGGS